MIMKYVDFPLSNIFLLIYFLKSGFLACCRLSINQKAQLVLDQVRLRCQADSQTNNRWTGRSGNYMYIMGRENADGKATGVVHKFQPDGSHKLAGSFKIYPMDKLLDLLV